MGTMRAARLGFWLLVIHLVTFYKQNPWHFLVGLAVWPHRFLLGLIQHDQKAYVNAVIYWFAEGLESGQRIMPPKYLVRRLLAVADE